MFQYYYLASGHTSNTRPQGPGQYEGTPQRRGPPVSFRWSKLKKSNVFLHLLFNFVRKYTNSHQNTTKKNTIWETAYSHQHWEKQKNVTCVLQLHENAYMSASLLYIFQNCTKYGQPKATPFDVGETNIREATRTTPTLSVFVNNLKNSFNFIKLHSS